MARIQRKANPRALLVEELKGNREIIQMSIDRWRQTNIQWRVFWLWEGRKSRHVPQHECTLRILCSMKETSHKRTVLYDSTSVQFSSVQSLSHVRLCDPMNRSMPGLPVHHQLPEFTQTHVHRISDAIKPSHPLSSPSPAPNHSQHQSLFQWVNSLHQVAKELEFQLQYQSFR